ncbi:hypothetical protein YC2023_075607 [Brassica napus]|uniref:F-box domain-containing protein n=1 Tax=Brassica oleracea TaxID=3712 RepID=A0A3P6GKA5_BRAOL|nr:unnamed protein product [Brassica oleracea]
MDQQEETIEQINKKRRKQSTFTFPLDLISEILSKLPAKSVGRFRCVSKLWSSITTAPYFINKFETQSRQKKPSLLVTFKKGDRLFVFSIPQDRQSSNEPHTIPSQPVHSYHMTYPKSRRFFPRASVHGLICCFQKAKKLIIWNPTTRKLYTLTKPEKRWKYATFLLGYDPTDAKYKVLCIRFGETTDEGCVLTLGSAQESWRRIKTNHKHYVYTYPAYVCTNGFIYYTAYADKTDRIGFIMSFDVRSEKFRMIKYPWNAYWYFSVLTYQGMLACLRSNIPGHSMTLWILQDAEKHVWSPKNFLVPFHYYDQSLKLVCNLIGITDAGEIVYVPERCYKSFYVIYYDSERNKFHRVEYKGIADDESRLKNGLVRSRTPILGIFRGTCPSESSDENSEEHFVGTSEDWTIGKSIEISRGSSPSVYSEELSDEHVVLGISSEICFLGIPSENSEGFPRNNEFLRSYFRGLVSSETTEQIHKKARIKSQESVVRSSFPLDLISEILSKLPAKSVGRFRCVSKLWSSVTTDPYFINKFETQSRQRKPCLLVSFKRDDRLFVFSIPQDRQSSNEYHPIASQPVHSYHMTYPKSRRFFPRVSVHGLISCFQEETKPIIWNPTTRKLLILTKPEKSWEYATFFLGYDPVDAKHSFVHAF